MHIGIIYIATGNYIEFFTNFFNTAEKNFIPEAKKTYFVFTDKDHPYLKKHNVIHIPQHQEFWPDVALHKFHYILEAQHLIKKTNFVFMFNANMIITDLVEAYEVLPSKEDNWLVGVKHAEDYYYNNGQPYLKAFEENPNSTAYIKTDDIKEHFASEFVGGRTPEFLELCLELRNNIERDFINNIIAKWHDETHINKYFSKKSPKTVSPSYCHWFNVNFPIKIKVITKENLKGSKSYYRKYPWQNNNKPKNFFQKIRQYSIYYLIKFLTSLDK